MASEEYKRRLDEGRWAVLKPKCEAAAAYSKQAIENWADISAQAVVDKDPSDRRWVLADLRERCFEAGIECPYTVTYLVQLAETHPKVKGDFQRGVAPSVLVEGRNLPDLLDVVKPGMTVKRMKAIVTKRFNPDDSRSVEEIEAEQTRQRLDGRERSKRRAYAEKIANWPLDKSDDLLLNLRAETRAYQDAINRLFAEGNQFDAGDLAATIAAQKGLIASLESMIASPLSKAA